MSQSKSEARNQQDLRQQIARSGAYGYRNNVGATPAKCKACGAKQRPVRYGLANDSAQVNAVTKSSDLILAIPRLITPDLVGRVILQFGSVEVKPSDWRYKADSYEAAQSNWLRHVKSNGGFATFSTGSLNLNDIFSDYPPHTTG
jgi:hypothetical protein